MKKITLIVVCYAVLVSACTSKEEKLYRWENLEKELHELAVELANGDTRSFTESVSVPTTWQVAVPKNSDKPYRADFHVRDNEPSGFISVRFQADDEKVVRNIVRSIITLYGQPTVESEDSATDDVIQTSSETRYWETPAAWHTEIVVAKIVLHNDGTTIYAAYVAFNKKSL